MIKNLKNHYADEIKKCISDLKTKGRRKKQIPNILTFSRIVAPFVIVPCAFFSTLPITFIVTGAFALTDALDGVLARKLNATSDLGKELDPVADKVFASGLIIPLISKNPFILTNLLLEGVISGINLKSKLKGNEPKTNILGKIKTWALSSLVVSSYCSLFFNLSNTISYALLTLTSILQVVAAVKYFKDDKLKDVNKKDNSEENSIDIKEITKTHDEKESVKRKVIEALHIEKNLLENKNRKLGDYNNKTLHK